MARTVIRDSVLWTRQIADDGALARRIRALRWGETIVLRVEGRPVPFRRIADEAEGVAPEPSSPPSGTPSGVTRP